MTITLDTNCLIHLEDKRKGHIEVQEIISRSKQGELDVAVVAVSAIEKKINGAKIKNFSEFQNWLRDLGLGHLKILKPIFYLGIGYLDWCVLADDESIKLDNDIHDIICPDWSYHGPPEPLSVKWANRKVDVIIMWAHIWNKRKIFVTSDEDHFLKQNRKRKLQDLGAGLMLTPQEFIQRFPI